MPTDKQKEMSPLWVQRMGPESNISRPVQSTKVLSSLIGPTQGPMGGLQMYFVFILVQSYFCISQLSFDIIQLKVLLTKRGMIWPM